MAKPLSITFSAGKLSAKGMLAILISDDGLLGPVAKNLDEASGGLISGAIKTAEFSGKLNSALDIWLPAASAARHCILVGAGAVAENEETDWLHLGGIILAKFAASKESVATLAVEKTEGESISPDAAAQIALGMKLRSYKFDKYKTVKKDDNGDSKENGLHRITVAYSGAAKAKNLFASLDAVGDGVFLARDLVNEPANTPGASRICGTRKSINKT